MQSPEKGSKETVTYVNGGKKKETKHCTGTQGLSIGKNAKK